MPRLFTALEIPRDAALSLSLLRGGLPGARWIDVENYHLTLRFIGDVEGHVADEIANALDRVRRPSFPLALSGVGAFGSKKPHSIWAGVTASPDLTALQGEIDRICQRLGVAADPRKFMPHVTLARLTQLEPDRCRAISFGARQFLDRAVPGRPLRADVVARFGRRRALHRRGGLAAGGRRMPRRRAWPPAPPTPRGSCGRRPANAVCAAIVGIGHLRALPSPAIVQEEMDAVAGGCRRDRSEVARNIRYGPCRGSGRSGRNPSGATLRARCRGNVDAVLRRDGDRARVGRRADMPAAGAGRIER